MSGVPAYRLVKKRFSLTPFDGEGPRLFGSRWNSQGMRCIYVADSEALAILEVLVHLDKPSLINAYRLYRIHLRVEDVEILSNDGLPGDWKQNPAPDSTALIGDEWLEKGGALALAVPSAIAVRNRNFLMNPLHSRFVEVTGQAEELPLDVDQRLWARY